MLSSRLVLPERYGPHSATTRCAPLPGLPPVMVSDLMSFMTTSSLPRVRLRMKAPEGGRCRTRPERSLVLEIVSPRLGGVNPPVWRRTCTDSHRSGTKRRFIDILSGPGGRSGERQRSALPQIPTISMVAVASIFTAIAIRPQRNDKEVTPGHRCTTVGTSGLSSGVWGLSVMSTVRLRGPVQVVRPKFVRFVDLVRSFPDQARLALGTRGVVWATAAGVVGLVCCAVSMAAVALSLYATEAGYTRHKTTDLLALDQSTRRLMYRIHLMTYDQVKPVEAGGSLRQAWAQVEAAVATACGEGGSA